MDHVFRCKSHPEANGRRPVAGDEAFTAFFTTEDGGKVNIEMGREDYVNHAAAIVRMLQDDPAINREVEDAAEQAQTEDFLEMDTRKKRDK